MIILALVYLIMVYLFKPLAAASGANAIGDTLF